MTGSGPVPLAQATDPRRFGGKAATLARARLAGLPVPDGLVLDADTVQAICTGTDRAMLDALLGMIGGWGALAVRSSGLDEDGRHASFAGQHVTRLGVRPTAGAVHAAVTAVRDSATSPRALAYRTRLALAAAPAVAVLIQPLLPAAVSGVLFTRHPVTDADEMVIEATPGLGEAVVSGTVIPDRFRLRPDGLIIERVPGDKRVAVQPAPGGGTEEVPVPVGAAHTLSLDDRALAELHDVARSCARLFPGPLDIEWARTSAGTALLQCRPLTVP